MRKFWMVLIGLCFISGLLFAQTPEENFQNATQKVLACRELDLSCDKEEIEDFFDNMIGNTVDSELDLAITGEEMGSLKRMVRKFDKTKERYDKELEFYEVVTTTDIKPAIREHLEIYFEYQEGDPNHFYYRDNQNQDIRRYRVGQIGCDVTVEKSKWDWPYYILLALFWGVVAAVILGMISFLTIGDRNLTWGIVIVVFVLVSLLVL